MKKGLQNLLDNASREIDPQRLMDYLNGRLPEREKNEVERWLLEHEELGREALEGLQQLTSTQQLQFSVTKINHQLDRYLHQKKKKTKHRFFWPDKIAWVALLLLLLLAIAALLILQRLYLS